MKIYPALKKKRMEMAKESYEYCKNKEGKKGRWMIQNKKRKQDKIGSKQSVQYC